MAVTIPSVYYLMQPQIERYQHPERHGHGGHGGHDGHGEADEEGSASKGEESEDADNEDQGEGSEKDEGKSDDSSSDGEEKETPDTSDDEGSENTAHEKEGGGNVEGVQFKGATSGGTKEGEQGDTRKHIPDAKGFNKKRIESDYGGKEGEAQNPEQDPSNGDMVTNHLHSAFEKGQFANMLIQAAASKPAGDKTTQSGKQEGLSNTDTKHSTNIADDPEKSTKGEGRNIYHYKVSFQWSSYLRNGF